MRIFTILIAALSVAVLSACGSAGDGSEQSRRNQAGPYIGGSAGVGFH
ncbi:MAG TPA: hypothetical protein VGC09_17485 [Rhodopila sp.]